MNYYAQRLKDGTIYQKNNIYIKYYTKEQFKKYQASADIIGEIELKHKEKPNTKDLIIVQNENSISQFELKKLNPRHKVFGYLYLEENKFVKITKIRKFNLFFLILPIVLIFLLFGCFYFKNNNNKQKIEDTSQQVEVQPLSNENIRIPLYNSFTLNKENNIIVLSNPKENNVNFKYEIYKDNTLLFKTNEIEPNNNESINLLDYLNDGEYTLNFKIRCFDGTREVNGTNEEVNILISND